MQTSSMLWTKPRLFAATLVIAMASCGGNGTDVVAPTISSVSPPNGAVGIARNSVITATFDEDLLPASVNSTSFTLTGNSAEGGVVAFDSLTNVASFTPDSELDRLTTYTATLTTDVTDLSGNALAVGYSWSFTTADASFSDPVGVLDPSFAATGVYADPLAGYSASCLGLQSSDKIILGGSDGLEWTVIRLDADGTLDTTFGTNG
ncbi:MAG: hypothetical protein GY759_13120, partial [Chloroflexi bacterium]|nr:hypothetical protein [Chloroflexota bacterium]